MIIIPIVVFIAGYYGIKVLMHSIQYESTDNAQIEGELIPIIPRISGQVKAIHVDDYGKVTQGQLLVEIDPDEFNIALAQAEADLVSAQADLDNAYATSGINTQSEKLTQANLSVLHTNTEQAKRDYERNKQLYADKAITLKTLQDSETNYTARQQEELVGHQQVRTTGAQLHASSAQIDKMKAMIKARQAALDKAKLNLSYTKLYAPASGVIGRANIKPGQMINTGQTLFSIVDTSKFWVVANFKETQLEKLKLGQEVHIQVDGYSDDKIMGKISSFSAATGARFSLLPPDNATGNFVKVTQRVPVKISIDDPHKWTAILKAGLNVDVDVKK